MVCDYYIQSDLVIVYYDKCILSSTRTNLTQKRGYIMSIDDKYLDDNEETRSKKWNEKLEQHIESHTYKKILYENDKWIKNSYEKKYLKQINMICPQVITFVKIYIDYYAWVEN